MKTITLELKELDNAIFVALVANLDGATEDRAKLRDAMNITDKIMVKFTELAEKQAKSEAGRKAANARYAPLGAPLDGADAGVATAVAPKRAPRLTKKERLDAAIAENARVTQVPPTTPAAPAPAVIPQFIPQFGPGVPTPFGAPPEPERI